MDPAARRMLWTAAVLLAGSTVLLAFGAMLGRDGVLVLGMGGSVLAFAHPIVLEEDLRRRGIYDAGCGHLFLSLLIPPLGVSVYLAATYREKALVLIPLYSGVVGTCVLAGLGAGKLV